MSKIFWTIFEVLINFYQGAVITYFVYSFLSAKSIKTAKSLGLICALLMGTVITALNYIAVFEGMGTILYWVIIFLYSCIAFKDNPIKKVFSTIVPLVIMFLITSINLNLFSSFNNISVGELVTTQNIQRFLALMSIQVSYLICVIIVLKLFKFATEKFSLKDWIPVISVLLVSILLVAVLHILSLNAIDTHKKIY